jgi:hypothetical protein
VDPRKHALGKMKFIELLVSTQEKEVKEFILQYTQYATTKIIPLWEVDRKKNINFFVHDYCTLQASIFQK